MGPLSSDCCWSPLPLQMFLCQKTLQIHHYALYQRNLPKHDLVTPLTHYWHKFPWTRCSNVCEVIPVTLALLDVHVWRLAHMMDLQIHVLDHRFPFLPQKF
eukprot:TRINITY_DN436_c0_g2_i3.p1 TRINITY_DN436_c0_g2~~TRINITY_DN436_c0_g2_i3.p1  ORF type:complete len:101 (-),score=0.17 TRINITY_DN436_c0_g2_i3:496-798(-)